MSEAGGAATGGSAGVLPGGSLNVLFTCDGVYFSPAVWSSHCTGGFPSVWTAVFWAQVSPRSASLQGPCCLLWPGFHGRGTQRDRSPLLCPLSSCTSPHRRPSRLSASGPLAWSTLRLTRPLHPSSPRCVLRAGPLSFNSIRAFRNTHSFDLLPAAPLYFPLLLGFIYPESV